MVLKNSFKYMHLEGEEELLFDMRRDPAEMQNLANDSGSLSKLSELRAIAMDSWDPDDLRSRITESQLQRLFIHRVTGGEPSYVHEVNTGDCRKYVRNAGAADTKALARFPYVEPSLPPQMADH